MSPFTNTRTKRRTVFAVLAVWLFALSSGWANACLLQDRSTHIHRQSDSTSVAARTPVVSAGHVGAVSEHDGASDAAKGACLKVCDDGTQTLVKWQANFDLPDAGMTPPVAFIWTAHAVAPPVEGLARATPPPIPGVPVRTRFSRLAL
jgi:hypothetical protein